VQRNERERRDDEHREEESRKSLGQNPQRLTTIIFSSTNGGEKIIAAVPICFVTRIYSEIWEIDARLRDFGVTRDELMQIVRGVVGARADAVENDPVTAEGLFAYIFGTRYLRALFRTKGWLLHRELNIETVQHPNRSLKIIYQSVDLAASKHHDPQAISGKGSGADRIIDSAQGSLFTDEQLVAGNKTFGKIDSGVWFFCVSADGEHVRAELSLPLSIEDGNFKGFIERIFLVCDDDEWSGFVSKHDEAAAAEFEPTITRK